MKLTKTQVLRDLSALPENYKTKDVDRLISGYVREKADPSALRKDILSEQRLHRVYFFTALRQIKGAEARMEFIDKNLLFSDWWHTDQLIHFVTALRFETLLTYAQRYVQDGDPFIRRWGYVMFVSKQCQGHAAELLPLMHDDSEYYVRMGEAWLIAELAIFEPDTVCAWMKTNGLAYDINGRAIQKICDSYRISDEWKEKFKALRNDVK